MSSRVFEVLNLPELMAAPEALEHLSSRANIEHALLLMHAGALKFKTQLQEPKNSGISDLGLDSAVVKHLQRRGITSVDELHVAGPSVLFKLHLDEITRTICILSERGIFIGATEHFSNVSTTRYSTLDIDKVETLSRTVDLCAALFDSMTRQHTRFASRRPNRNGPTQPADVGIEYLHLRTRSHNALRRSTHITTLNDITQRHARDFLGIPNFGLTSLIDVAGVLADNQVWFGDMIETSSASTQEPLTGISTLDRALAAIRTTPGIRLDHLAESLELTVKDLRILLAEHFGLTIHEKKALRLRIMSEFALAASSKSGHVIETDEESTILAAALDLVRTTETVDVRQVAVTLGIAEIALEQLLIRHYRVCLSWLDVALRAEVHIFRKNLDGVNVYENLVEHVTSGCCTVAAVRKVANLTDMRLTAYMLCVALGHPTSPMPTSRVMREVLETKFKAHRQTMRNHRVDHRAKAMVELRIAGATLNDIGKQFNVSSERVRQIVQKHLGAESASDAGIKLLRFERECETLRDFLQATPNPFPLDQSATAIIVQASSSLDDRPIAIELRDLTQQHLRRFLTSNTGIHVDDLVAALGLGVAVVQRVVPSEFRRFVIRGNKTTFRQWSDDEIIRILQTAATYHFPLTGQKYDSLVAIGEIDGPTAVRILQIFGSWSGACDRAGVEHAEPFRQHYDRQWTEADLKSIVAEYLLDDDSLGTFADFERWLTKQTGYPSGQTVRNYLGEWLVVKQQVLTSSRFKEHLHGI